MKLLIITQAMDVNNPVLGFFVRWVQEFSKHCEKVTVICLEKGEHQLPENVKILSLGKEVGASKVKYIFNFYRYIWQERKNYDVVFVHMNQEYVILGWKLWKILGKKIMMWRNHPMGNFFTNVAVWVSDRVFCTSQFSYTAKFKKTEIVSVGIDTELFKRNLEIKKIPNSILFLGRISPIKNVDILIEALNKLNKDGVDFNALIVGDYILKDRGYYENLKNRIKNYGLGDKIKLVDGIKNAETIDLYNKYEIYINLTPTGSMDKTIFEAMACESLVLVLNLSLVDKINNIHIYKNDVNLAIKIKELLYLETNLKVNFGKKLRDYVIENHNLEKTIATILR